MCGRSRLQPPVMLAVLCPPARRLQSYTSSPLDPQARLFYNPAYNDDTITRMSDSKSIIRWVGGVVDTNTGAEAGQLVPTHPRALRLPPPPRCSASHIPRPGYLTRSVSQPASMRAAPQASSQTQGSLDTQARR